MAKGISRERIVETALELLDDVGIEGVTARALAQRLGVRAPALYWHLENKQELLDEMGTEIRRRMANALAELPTPQGWRDGLAAYAHVVRAEYLRHRDGARTFSGTRVTDPDVLRAQQLWMERWTHGGLRIECASVAVQLVTAFVVGFVIEEQLRTEHRQGLAETDDELAEELPLVLQVGAILARDSDERFELCLDVALEGVAARFDPSAAA